jgi:DNA polymerase III delta prime subunit
MMKALSFALYLLFSIGIFVTEVAQASASSQTSNNSALKELTQADQAARTSSGEKDWDKISQEDMQRRKAVLQMLKNSEVITSADYFNAALIFQHGDTLEDIRLAYSLATISYTLNNENKSAKWLSAAAWDRMMMYKDRPQWFGTQYRPDETGVTRLYKVDESVITDAERQEMNAPTLQEAKDREKIFNQK